MKKNIVSIMAILWAANLAAKIMVLPLRVDAQNHASSQWLGKAFSYYLLAGLFLNDLPVLDHEEVQFVLNRNLVRFPFDITKATSMVLARKSQADQLLGGEILYDAKKAPLLTVKLFVIDVKKRTQKHLPLIKGDFKEMYKIQEELLKVVVKALAAPGSEIRLPELNLALPDYERFSKSLLLADAAKKLELLLPEAEKGSPSDMVNFELAKIYFARAEFAKCESLLSRISDTPLFMGKKDFLLALTDYALGNIDIALNRFIQLQRRDSYAVATHNNLGVIYLRKGDMQTAEKCLQYAVFLKKDPEVFSNLVCLLQAMGKNSQAQDELSRALQLFPDDERLQKLFVRMAGADKNREALTQAFRNFVPLLAQSEELASIEPLLVNPFQIKSLPEAESEANSFYIEARNFFLEDDFNEAMRKVEEAMEVNPFLHENHHLLALLYLQKKQYGQAENFARSALFLKENLDIFLLQLKIFQAAGEREKFSEALALALGKYPQSPELLEWSGRGL